MPAALGLIQIDRFTIYNTQTQITSISPSSGDGYCGGDVFVDVSVSNTEVFGPTPTGTISIIDELSGDVLTSDIPLVGGVANSTLINVAYGTSSLIAIYDGYLNHFATSQSDPYPYLVGLVSTTTSIVTPVHPYYCYSKPISITGRVVAASGRRTAKGTVSFKLWKTALSSVNLPSGRLDNDGYATTTIAANTLTSTSGVVHVQAIYPGFGCFTTSSSPSGLSGTALNPTSHDTTTTTISILESDTFCLRDGYTIQATITPTNLPLPSTGTVSFQATKDSDLSVLSLGSVFVNNGLASLTVPGSTFASDTYYIKGSYTGDGYCYDNSSSPSGISGFAIHPMLYTTTSVGSGTSTFCASSAETFSCTISSATVGTLSGTCAFNIYSGATLVKNLGNIDVVGPNTGVVVNAPYVSNTIAGGSYTLVCVFTADSDSCYASSTSSPFSFTINPC